jgi:hypothetical protein
VARSDAFFFLAAAVMRLQVAAALFTEFHAAVANHCGGLNNHFFEI